MSTIFNALNDLELRKCESDAVVSVISIDPKKAATLILRGQTRLDYGVITPNFLPFLAQAAGSCQSDSLVHAPGWLAVDGKR